MAVQTLAVKYRPTTFKDVSEQNGIISILENQLKTQTYVNAYLFTGGAGTGKTTCARIFARELNTTHQGAATDYAIEIDAASNNGVENVRAIIENSKFQSITSFYKIYIIDECHQLSTGAWNAMLKLIEEPPAKTIFIFCTTDPQKIPATILSRVQRYDFRRISEKGIVARLKNIVAAENREWEGDMDEKGHFRVTDEAFEYIAKVADGGMRNAISILDKCLSLTPVLGIKAVTEAIGTLDYATLFSLLNALYDGQDKAVLEMINQFHADGVDLKQFVKTFYAFVLDVIKFGLTKNYSIISIPSTYESLLAAVVACDRAVLQRFCRRLVDLSGQVKWETNAKPVIEIVFMLLCKEE